MRRTTQYGQKEVADQLTLRAFRNVIKPAESSLDDLQRFISKKQPGSGALPGSSRSVLTRRTFMNKAAMA